MFFYFNNNTKGQALIEAVIIMNIMLMLFFGMILFSTYIFDKMVVAFAANLAIDEAIGKIPLDGMTEETIEDLMEVTALGALNLGMFLDNKYVIPEVIKDPDAGKISITIQATYSVKLPFVSQYLNNNIIENKTEVDYSW